MVTPTYNANNQGLWTMPVYFEKENGAIMVAANRFPNRSLLGNYSHHRSKPLFHHPSLSNTTISPNHPPPPYITSQLFSSFFQGNPSWSKGISCFFLNIASTIRSKLMKAHQGTRYFCSMGSSSSQLFSSPSLNLLLIVIFFCLSVCISSVVRSGFRSDKSLFLFIDFIWWVTVVSLSNLICMSFLLFWIGFDKLLILYHALFSISLHFCCCYNTC